MCKAILAEFQQEYLICTTELEDWRGTEDKPQAVDSLDGKHIAIKKLKKSECEYLSYKGYFLLVLLALVDAEYKFLWVNVAEGVVPHLIHTYSTIAS